MTRFVKYILSHGAQRFTLVQGFDEPYSPVKDPYGRARRAIRAGRRTGEDKKAIEAAIQNCRPQMRRHYLEIADGWLPMAQRLENTTLIPSGTARWDTGDLTIKVTPDLVLAHPDGSTDALKLHLHSEPIPADGVEVMLWLMRQTLDQSHPGARPIVVDVRRGKAHWKIRPRPGYAHWLESEAASLAFLYRRQQRAA